MSSNKNLAEEIAKNPPPQSSQDLVSNIVTKVTTLANNLSGALVDKLMNPPGSPRYIKKTNDKYLKKFTDASNNYSNAPFELSLAEKNFYVYNNGEPNGDEIYNLTIIDRFANTANDLRMNSIDKQQEFMANLTESLKQYQGEKLFSQRTVQLLQVRQKENADLIKKMEMYERILQTSERKVVYEVKDSDSLHTWRRAMLFLYYTAVVCYIIFSNFIPDKLYNNKIVWLIIVIVSLIPIILNLVIKWIFIIFSVLGYWVKELPHKDVYAELGEDRPSAP